jgi:3-methyladenine DNA glycosylase AlkD
MRPKIIASFGRTDLNLEEVLREIKSHSNPSAVEGMSRFGINTKNTYGLSKPQLQTIAKKLGKDHLLAQRLWSTGIHEAKIIACMIDRPREVTEAQMEEWVHEFDSWDVCDGCCSELFDKTSLAYRKAVEWSRRREEFVKRAGFVLMATLAVHDKEASDTKFQRFLPIIKRESEDERNFVKKAVNWALRQIGKRNRHLNQLAIKTAKQIQGMDSKSARWIASDALRELTSPDVRRRLRTR